MAVTATHVELAPGVGWGRAWRISSLVALTIAAGVVATGAYLWFEYRPTAAQAWDDIAALHGRIQVGLVVRMVHRLLALLLVPAVVAAVVCAVGDARERGRSFSWRVVAVPAAVLGVVSGVLVAWDQLALWAVQVGTNVSGMQAVFSDRVRFVIIDGHEIPVGTFRFWAVVHVLAGVLVVGALVRRPQR